MKKLAAIVLLLALIVIPRVAANSFQLSISPVRTELTAQPGSIAQASISVKNSTNKLTTVNVSSRDFAASDEQDGTPKILDTSNAKYGISNWFTDANIDRQLTIPGNQTVTYEAKFRVPNGAAPRTYFGSVMFTSINEDNERTSVGSLVFITIGNPTTAPAIDSVAFGESGDASQKHGVFTAIVKNTGEGLMKPEMRLKITDDSGKTVVELNPYSTGGILPESSRKFSFSPSSELPNKNMTATLSVVDQNGKTADASIQLNRATEDTSETEPVAASKNNPFLWLGLIPIIAMLGAANKFMAHRKKQEVPPEPPTDTPEVPTPPTNNI